MGGCILFSGRSRMRGAMRNLHPGMILASMRAQKLPGQRWKFAKGFPVILPLYLFADFAAVQRRPNKSMPNKRWRNESQSRDN
jgi:hypothetical protein